METAALREEATMTRINVYERVSALSLAPFDRFTDYRRTLRDIVVGWRRMSVRVWVRSRRGEDDWPFDQAADV
jgi:hypothetical protein